MPFCLHSDFDNHRRHASVTSDINKMKDSLPRFKKFATLGIFTSVLMVSLGLISGAFGQDAETVALWREWMSVLQKEPSQVTGPRIYVMTDREVLQTSPEKATFQSGSYRMILADGSVPDVDGDLDNYTDVLEDNNVHADRNDPELVPLAGNPLLPVQPTNAFPILMANGSVLGIAKSAITTNGNAQLVREAAGAGVRVIGAPASNFQRPVSFRDFSGQFYFYYVIPGSTTGTYNKYPLSLYYLNKDFPEPQDGNALETSLVPGGYTVEFPTIVNAPYGKSSVQVAHRLVPNGALTVGLKKPTWLVRSLKSYEKENAPPVEQKWVNGRLKFDPYLPFAMTWDNIVGTGLASSADYIEMSVEDENQGGVSRTFRVNATTSTLSISLAETTYAFYGTIRESLEAQTYPLNVNGHIVLRYFRYANGQSTGDLSSVTLRVPIEMYVSYASWRNELFALNASNDSISGPNADPDKDGLTNQQEYNQATDPLVSSLAVVNANSTDITVNSAFLGATVVQDPLTENNPLYGNTVQIYERGMVYSPSLVNSTPVIDGPGVNRVVSAPAEVGTFTVAVTGLSAGTAYSYRGYVITSTGTYYSTPVSSFTTVSQPPVTLPTVISPTSSGITSTSATLGGNVTSSGGSTITERGVVYSRTSTNDNPFIAGTGVTKVVAPGTTGIFTVNAAGLLANTAYSFRAYAINSVGTSYTSAIGSFTTPPATTAPVITSPTSANITSSSATLGGNVTGSGGATVLQRGVVFSLTATNANPSIGGTGVSNFSATTAGTGVFTVNSTGLTPGRSYSFKAYAINSVGTSYTAVGTFTTSGNLATVSSPTISSLAATSVTLGGNVTNDGGSTILERGFVYSKTVDDSNPNVGDPGVIKVTVAGTTGVLSSAITGLTSNTGYIFKAFARNAVGTAYGAPYSFFTTLPPLTVTSPTVANITATTATLGGTVVSDGGTTATERGVVYSITNPNPVIGGPGVLPKVIVSGTMGVFTTVPAVSGLSSGTNYYFRAYAINSAGTSYSPVASFETLPMLLLGLAQVQWVPVEQQSANGGSLARMATSSPEPDLMQAASVPVEATSVPEFVYFKEATESLDPITYRIEVTTDYKEWLPIDENLWQVDNTAELVSARWKSTTETPPACNFFRVVGSTN
jgi:hypothetical protein